MRWKPRAYSHWYVRQYVSYSQANDITEQGKVHGWGSNQRGMIGLGPKIAKFEFATKIKFIHNDKEFIIKDIAAGPQHVAAIDGNFNTKHTCCIN